MQICASSNDMLSGCSNPLKIVEPYVNEVRIELSDVNPTAYFDFKVTGYLFDQFGSPFIETATTTLTSDADFIGDITRTTSSGTVVHSLYCKSPGVRIFMLTSLPGFAEVSVNVLKQRLIFAGFPKNDIKLLEPFSFSVRVCSNDGSLIQSKYGSFVINLDVTPSGWFNGASQGKTSSGVLKYTEVTLNQTDQFTFTASSEELLPGTQQANVVFDKDIIINIESLTEEVKEKYLYSFIGTVMNTATGLPVADAVVEIYINGTLFDEIQTDENGQVNLTTYFSFTGNTEIKFVYRSAKASENVVVQPSNNTDPLCVIALNTTACRTCKALSYPSEDLGASCECTSGAFYIPLNNSCVCSDNLEEVAGMCLHCRSYFLKSEINSYYSNDYKSIYTEFSRNVKIIGLKKCSEIITSPDYALNGECIWITPSLLQVKLSSYPILTSNILSLNELQLEAADSKCSFNYEELKIPIKKNSSYSVQQASISGPNEYSLLCGKSNLQLISNNQGQELSFIWTCDYLPSNSKVCDFVSQNIKNFLDIPRDLLTPGTLTVTLNLTTGEIAWSSAVKVIKITEKPALSVSITPGAIYYHKTSQSLTISAVIKEKCSQSEDFTFKWTSSSLDSSVQNVLNSQFSEKFLKFSAFSLKPRKSYDFRVVVSQGTATGTASTTIIVKDSSLEISLDKSDGNYSMTEDFSIKPVVKDPDDSSSVILKTWTCFQTDHLCKDKDGKPLHFSQSSGNLLVSYLKLDEASYTFYLSASTSNKLAFTSLTATFSRLVSGSITISTDLKKVNPDYIYNIIPEIKVGGFPTFTWTVEGTVNDASVDYTNSYLGLPEFSLQPGAQYLFSLSPDNSKVNRIVLRLLVNNGPSCEKVSAIFEDPTWTIASLNCVDLDDEDYPLVYQTGVVEKDQSAKWINEVTLENVVKIYIPQGYKRVVVRVCDCLETCRMFYEDINQKKRRTSDELMDLIDYLKTSSNFPNGFMAFLTKNSEYPVINYLMETFSKYFQEIIENPDSFSMSSINKYTLELILDCFNTLLDSDLLPEDQNLLEMAEPVVKFLEKYPKRIRIEKILQLFKKSEKYFSKLDKTSLNALLEHSADHLVIDTTPGTTFQLSSDNHLVQVRKLALGFVGLKLQEKGLHIFFPESLEINETLVYDFYFAAIVDKSKIYIKMGIFAVGTFKQYTLKYIEKNEAQVVLKDALKIFLPNTFQIQGARCSTPTCQVLKVNDSMIEVDFFVFSEGEIKEFVFICQFAREPIQISGILIFVALIASLVFYDNDKVDLLVENNFFTFKTFYHVSSLFVRQKKFRRLSAVFEVLSTMLVIMAVVGISIQRIDSEVSRLELDFRSFTVEAFGSGILALCCSQVLTVVNFILKYFRYSNERLDSHLIVFNFTISIIAFIAICCICASYCIGQVVDWMVNFLIFTVVQMFILEPVYSAVVYLVCKKRQIAKGKRVTMPSEVTDSKVFRVINTSGFTLQETPTNRSLIKTSPRILFD